MQLNIEITARALGISPLGHSLDCPSFGAVDNWLELQLKSTMAEEMRNTLWRSDR